MAILIPEVIIYKTLNSVLDIIRQDYSDNIDKKKTILYYLFGEDTEGSPLSFNNFEFFTQAVEIIVGSNEKKRMIQTALGYNMSRLQIPTIHIMLPSESPINSPIGMNLGYQEEIVDNSKNETIEVYTMDSQVTYNLLITSDNYHEVLVIYQFLKGIFTSIKNQLEMKDLQNVTFGGSDLNFSEELVPPNIFHRNFNLQFTYDYVSVDIIKQKFGTDFIVKA